MNELDSFLAAHPDIEHFDAFLNDINTVEWGKRLDRKGLEKAYVSGMLLPGSMFALDVLGGTVEATGLGFDEGDADRPCMPIPQSLVRTPWLKERVAQVQLSMFERSGAPFFGNPREVLAGVLEKFKARGLTPCVAVE